MKKIVFASLIAASFALPAFAAEEAKKEAMPSATPAAAKEATPAAGATKVELKNGAWAEKYADGTVKVSTDAGKTWTAAPDGKHEAKDGSFIETKGGKIVK